MGGSSQASTNAQTNLNKKCQLRAFGDKEVKKGDGDGNTNF